MSKRGALGNRIWSPRIRVAATVTLVGDSFTQSNAPAANTTFAAEERLKGGEE